MDIVDVIRAVKGVMRQLSQSRANGPDGILIEFWKSTDVIGLEYLTELINVIFKTVKMPNAQR